MIPIILKNSDSPGREATSFIFPFIYQMGQGKKMM